MVTLYLCSSGLLGEPLLYLSLFLKENRDEYYRLLGACRTEGDREAWVVFFLEGVAATADNAVSTARTLAYAFERDRERIRTLGRRAGSALRVHEALKARPPLLLPEVAEITGLSFPTAASGMEVLENLGIVRELTGKKRNRAFAHTEYVALLSEGT